MTEWMVWPIIIAVWLLEKAAAAGSGAWIITLAILLLAGSVKILRGQIWLTGQAILQEISATKDRVAGVEHAMRRIDISLSHEVEATLELLLKDEREKRGYVYVCGNKECEAYSHRLPWEDLRFSSAMREHNCPKCQMELTWIRMAPPDG